MTKMDIALSDRPASSGKAGDRKQAAGGSFLDTLTLSSILAPIFPSPRHEKLIVSVSSMNRPFKRTDPSSR